MATTIYPTVPVAQPEAEAWPVDDHPLGIQADEMFARQLDTGFAGEVRNLLHDPATGLAGKGPEDALGGIAEAIPMLGELKDRYLAQAIGPRQRTILEPLIDSRLDRATGDLGQIAEQATSALDDRIVAERIADLQQDASLSWHDPAHLRLLGRSAVNELRYQGERRGWDEAQTDTTVRQGLSDLYAGAVERAIGEDRDRAAKLYEHARDVIQPERQAAIERKIERAREERRVTEIVGVLAEAPDDPTRRPALDDYQARAAELTPSDASPEVRAQVNRMARIEHAQADRAWQAARGRAAVAAVDWLGKNPATRPLSMPPELRDGLSPEQTDALDAAAINGGRVATDRDLYEALDGQAVHEPEAFAGIDLTQHRLSLGDRDYQRLVGFQKALVEGRSDAAFERHGLGRTFLDEGLRKANFDPDGPEAQALRQQLDRLLGAFEAVEGRPPTMADIRSLVGDALRPLADDPNIVRVNAPGVTEAVDDGQGAQQQVVEGRQEGESDIVPAQSEGALRPDESVVQSDGQGRTVDGEGDSQGGEGDIQVAQAPSNKPGGKGPSTPKHPPGGGQKPPANKPATGVGKKEVNKRTAAQIAQDAKTRQDKTWPEAIQAPVPKLKPEDQQPLPDDWEQAVNRINPDYLKWTKDAAEKNGIPPELLARLINKESTYDNKRVSKMGAKGLAQLTPIAIKHLGLDPATFDYSDDKASIEAGAALLGGYYREFKNWPKAVAAYNMGNTRLREWLSGKNDATLRGETRAMLWHVFRGQPEVYDKPR